MKSKLQLCFTLLAIVILAIACSPATTPPPAPTATPVPPPTATPAPLYQQVTLTSADTTENGHGPDFTITLRTPTLGGSADPRVAAFNSAAQTVIQKGVDEFRTNLINLQPLPDIGATSMFDQKYELVSPPGNVFSLKFIMEGYIEGMAHPYHVTVAFNYDLNAGREIALASLFLPGSNYLETISNYCIAQLQTRDIGFDMFSDGASPKPENYQMWNITPDGLLITFNEYQVAPYAAGPQTVTIPYAELSALIDPQGVLAQFLP